MVSEPSADETPYGDEGSVSHQDQPDLSSSDNKEGYVDAYIVGSIGEGQECDGGHAEAIDAKPFRLGSPCLKQQPYADCQRHETKESNPAVRYGKSRQSADQADDDDSRETYVLTGHDAARRNPSSEKQSQ